MEEKAKRRISKIEIFLYLLAITLVIFSIIYNFTSMNDSAKVNASQTVWTISDYNGKVALFKNNRQSPEEVFDTYVSDLPKSDQELIYNGIKTGDEARVQELIEDFTG